MSIERWIRLIAGTFVIASLTRDNFQSRHRLPFTLFVGVNLFQSALTRLCLMEDVLRALGVGRSPAEGANSPTAAGRAR